MSAQPAGPVVDSLGINLTLDEGDLVDGGVLLLSVVKADGTPVVKMCSSSRLPWLTRRGLMEVAIGAERERGDSERDA